MTTIDERSGPTRAHDVSDPSALLPLWPWNALRPASGMLLDNDDFEVLLGNPRAKHMIHNAWLHGSGVVWGLSVERSGEWDLVVSPGLGIDGLGRELHVDAPVCLPFREILEKEHDPTCERRVIRLCLVLSFDACADRPVPALADPCDVTRESQEYSRVNERARLSLVLGHPPVVHSYHRVRVLLGLERAGVDDDAGAEALAARNEILAAPAHQRAGELLRVFRCLAALDARDLGPTADDDCEHELFPVGESDAGIVLACLDVTVKDESGCPEIVGELEFDDCCRRTVIPTTVIQELVCALAPGFIGVGGTTTGAGPQAVPGSIEWGPRPREFSFAVTEDLLPATVTRRSVKVSSLSPGGWVIEHLARRPRYRAKRNRVVVRLDGRPENELIRVVVVGTGARPIYGAQSRLPLAGVVGDDPGTTGQGRDAVLTAENPFHEHPHPHEGHKRPEHGGRSSTDHEGADHRDHDQE